MNDQELSPEVERELQRVTKKFRRQVLKEAKASRPRGNRKPGQISASDISSVRSTLLPAELFENYRKVSKLRTARKLLLFSIAILALTGLLYLAFKLITSKLGRTESIVLILVTIGFVFALTVIIPRARRVDAFLRALAVLFFEELARLVLGGLAGLAKIGSLTKPSKKSLEIAERLPPEASKNHIRGKASATETEQDSAISLTSTGHLAAGEAAISSRRVMVWSMVAVLAAMIIMWFLYRYVIKPHQVGLESNYVPYLGIIALTVALERLLEPLSRTKLLMPDDSAKANAAKANSDARTAAANTAMKAADAQVLASNAADAQAVADAVNASRTVLFWAIASICGLVISGAFGLFLFQPTTVGPVNSFLDLAVTGLAIGAGTKPLHDFITRIQAKAANSA